MKIRFLAALGLLMALPTALSGQNTLTYFLPSTHVGVEVEAVVETFHAGPYARFAGKYLGVDARLGEGTSYSISSIRVRTLVEADSDTRYTVALNSNSSQVFLQLTNEGLVAGPEGAFSVDSGWKYPKESVADFVTRGLPANLTTEENTLYTRNRGTVMQSALIEKSDETKAAEVASRIFEIRENRYKILVGDTDATYSGEAMKATIDALDKMEADYLTLFLGYSENSVQTATFEVVPSPSRKNQLYVAFRLSDSSGLVGPEDIDGNPVYLQLTPEASQAAPEKLTGKQDVIRYRIPAVCTLTLKDMKNTLLSMRVPVYQLGREAEYPIFKK